MKKLIIFDCDGVLVDSEIIANRIDAEIFTKIGYAISIEDSIKKFTGVDSKTVQQIIFEESGILFPENLLQTKDEAILHALKTELQPLIKPALEHPTLKKFEKCVASSSPKQRVLKSLHITKQDHFFKDHLIFTSEQVQNGKPQPDLFLFAAKKMGYPTKDCLVIEDSVAGIQAAKAAKMSVIGFLGGTHTQFDWYKEQIQKKN